VKIAKSDFSLPCALTSAISENGATNANRIAIALLAIATSSQAPATVVSAGMSMAALLAG